jgi:hypothetical protein
MHTPADYAHRTQTITASVSTHNRANSIAASGLILPQGNKNYCNFHTARKQEALCLSVHIYVEMIVRMST